MCHTTENINQRFLQVLVVVKNKGSGELLTNGGRNRKT